MIMNEYCYDVTFSLTVFKAEFVVTVINNTNETHGLNKK